MVKCLGNALTGPTLVRLRGLKGLIATNARIPRETQETSVNTGDQGLWVVTPSYRLLPRSTRLFPFAIHSAFSPSTAAPAGWAFSLIPRLAAGQECRSITSLIAVRVGGTTNL